MKQFKCVMSVLVCGIMAMSFAACSEESAKAENTVTFPEIASIDCYGTPELNASAQGEASITYTYATQEDGTYGAAPEHFVAGTYYVKATSAETDEYQSASAIRSFTVSHNFDRESAESKFLKEDATCTDAAVYYKSCACGEAGTETFSSGEANGHTPVSEYWREQGAYYYKQTCADCGTLLSSSDKIALVPDAEGEHTVTVSSWTEDDLQLGNDLVELCGNAWYNKFYATLVDEDTEGVPEGLNFEPAVQYSVMDGTNVMVALPLFDYSAYEEVSFYIASNGRPFHYGTLFSNFATYNESGNFTVDGESLITVKSDRKVYVDGVALNYTLDKQVYCGTLPLAFAGKGEDPDKYVFVSDLTANFAEQTTENAPVYSAGRIFAADEGNTSVMTSTGLIAHIDLNSNHFQVKNPIFFYQGSECVYSDGGYYSHLRETCDYFDLRVKAINYAAYNEEGLTVSFKVQTKNNANGFSLYYGDTAILEGGDQMVDHTIEIKDGKLYVDGAEKATLSDAVYYGEEALTLQIVLTDAVTDLYAGISISAIEAAAPEVTVPEE